MPTVQKLPLNELFETIQGEGSRVGTAATFVRLQGCAVGCPWCLDPAARFLLGNFQTIAAGDVVAGMAMIGTRRKQFEAVGPYERGVVEDVVLNRQPKVRVIFADDSEAMVSEQHRFVLSGASGRFRMARRLIPGERLRRYDPGTGNAAPTAQYRRGYLAGAADGDGSFHNKAPTSSGFVPRHFVIACHDEPLLDRVQSYAAELGWALRRGRHLSGGQFAPAEQIPCLRLTQTDQVASFEALVRADSPDEDWAIGYLAGMYDTDGSTDGTIMSWSQSKPRTRDRLLSVIGRLGLAHVADGDGRRIRLIGGTIVYRKLLARMRPVVERKVDRLWFQEHRHSGESVVKRVERIGPGDVVSIQTSLGTYVADGMPARNCDTKHTWTLDHETDLGTILDKTGDKQGFTWIEVDALLRLIVQKRSRYVVLTGGEPCHWDLAELTAGLFRNGYSIQIETSGTEPVRADDRTWVTMSPKLDMPGGLAVLDETLNRANEIKMPVGKRADIDKLDTLLARLRHPLRPDSVWLQPISLSAKATELCRVIAADRGWRVSLQLHKQAHVR